MLNYNRDREMRDLFLILVGIFMLYQQLITCDLKYKIKVLYESEHLQNKINTEIVKRLYLIE